MTQKSSNSISSAVAFEEKNNFVHDLSNYQLSKQIKQSLDEERGKTQLNTSYFKHAIILMGIGATLAGVMIPISYKSIRGVFTLNPNNNTKTHILTSNIKDIIYSYQNNAVFYNLFLTNDFHKSQFGLKDGKSINIAQLLNMDKQDSRVKIFFDSYTTPIVDLSLQNLSTLTEKVFQNEMKSKGFVYHIQPKSSISNEQMDFVKLTKFHTSNVHNKRQMFNEDSAFHEPDGKRGSRLFLDMARESSSTRERNKTTERLLEAVQSIRPLFKEVDKQMDIGKAPAFKMNLNMVATSTNIKDISPSLKIDDIPILSEEVYLANPDDYKILYSKPFGEKLVLLSKINDNEAANGSQFISKYYRLRLQADFLARENLSQSNKNMSDWPVIDSSTSAYISINEALQAGYQQANADLPQKDEVTKELYNLNDGNKESLNEKHKDHLTQMGIKYNNMKLLYLVHKYMEANPNLSLETIAENLAQELDNSRDKMKTDPKAENWAGLEIWLDAMNSLNVADKYSDQIRVSTLLFEAAKANWELQQHENPEDKNKLSEITKSAEKSGIDVENSPVYSTYSK